MMQRFSEGMKYSWYVSPPPYHGRTPLQWFLLLWFISKKHDPFFVSKSTKDKGSDLERQMGFYPQVSDADWSQQKVSNRILLKNGT